MALLGKGFMIWKIPSCERGSPDQIASEAKLAGLTHVLIKIADGITAYNVNKDTKVDLVPPVVQALKAQGIHVWGWHYLYGANPGGEAQIAVRRVTELGLQGYIVDAEQEFKSPSGASAARTFMTELRKGLPNKPVALSSYRFPSYHPQFPWNAFLEKCDYNMPQVYWEEAHNPGAQLERCVREFNHMTYVRPIMPTGPMYRTSRWSPTPADIQEFLEKAKALQLSSANFFTWDYKTTSLKSLWDVIAAFQWTPPPAPPKDLAERYIEALNSRDPAKVTELFRADAVHITAAQTIAGSTAIQSWYSTFFNQVMPNASFKLSGFTGTGSTRHLTWSAASSSGSIKNGSDTIGFLDGKIVYHYTAFKIDNI
jgi:hypothetical protein